jgi:hypothetical protein
MIANVIAEAKMKGACGRIDDIQSVASLVELMFSPQGREFCQNTKFLRVDRLNYIANEAEEHNVFIDKRNIITTAHKSAFIGSKGRVLCNGTEAIYNIIVADNSHIEIVATNYAVVMVTSINGSYNITKDKTARIL